MNGINFVMACPEEAEEPVGVKTRLQIGSFRVLSAPQTGSVFRANPEPDLELFVSAVKLKIFLKLRLLFRIEMGSEFLFFPEKRVKKETSSLGIGDTFLEKIPQNFLPFKHEPRKMEMG